MNNKKIIIFILNFFGFVLVFMSLTSYFPSTNFSDNRSVSNSPYNIELSGDINSQLDGLMQFTSTVEKLNHGVPYSTLILELKNNSEHKFSIIISQVNGGEPFSVGTYNVLKNKDEAFAVIDGVFGYLNMVKSNELPYYIEKGKIKITKIDKEKAIGYIDLELEDYYGKSIAMEGDFLASNTIKLK